MNNIIKNFVSIAESVFTEECIEFQWCIDKDIASFTEEELCNINNPIGHLTIHFPEVTITNEHSQSYTKKGLYMRLPIMLFYSRLSIGKIKLYCAHYTVTELHVGFKHPHATLGSPEHYSSVCLGKSTLDSLHKMFMYSIDRPEHTIIAYFQEIKRFISTESLSGGPYKSIRSVSNSVVEPQGRYTQSSYEHISRILEKDTLKLLLKETAKWINEGELTLTTNGYNYEIANPFLDIYTRINSVICDKVSPNYLTDIVITGSTVEAVYKINLKTLEEKIKDLEGYNVLNFKGKPVQLVVDNADDICSLQIYKAIELNLYYSIYNFIIYMINGYLKDTFQK